MFDRIHHPPPARPLTAADYAAIEREAERQLKVFYPVMPRDHEQRVRRTIQAGIASMALRGAARIWRGQVEFWNPIEGGFQEYDADYNQMMLEFMHDFRVRYQRGMQRRAERN